jgi:methylenetetrahydrofolate dehydrogenase (NADP+)/methenyltetrahydrofolate cyclohydrolase
MQLIDGKKIAAEVRGELKTEIAALKAKGIEPGLATILVGEDPASHVYVSSKIKMCNELGINSYHHHLPASVTEEEIVSLIRRLNGDVRVNGILLQLPLPKGLSADLALETIAADKDVDGLHPYNLGQLCSAKSWKEIVEKKLLVSCTPAGVILLLQKYKIPMEGKRAVVVGRSNLMGKPVSLMLLANNATVTIAHSRTENLAAVCAEADILIAAIGKPRFITKDFIKPGAAVLDVGVNRTNEGLCGDVDFEQAKEVAGYLTPVPGGVGAMTITMLMRNTLAACRRQNADVAV